MKALRKVSQLPAVLRPLNKIVPLIQLNGTLVIMANYLYTSKGDGSHDGVAIGDIDLCSHSVRSGLDLTEGVTHAGVLQGRHDGEELYVLHGLDGQRTLQMILQQFLGNLNDADTRSDGLARKMGLVDSVVGLQADVIADSVLRSRLTINHI